jgi:hypothetical protein
VRELYVTYSDRTNRDMMYVLACSLPHTYFSGIATGKEGIEDHDILHFHILLSLDFDHRALFNYLVLLFEPC